MYVAERYRAGVFRSFRLEQLLPQADSSVLQWMLPAAQRGDRGARGSAAAAQGTAGNPGKDRLCLETTELFTSGWLSAYFSQEQHHSGERKVYSGCPVVRGERAELTVQGSPHLREEEQASEPQFCQQIFSKAQNCYSVLAESAA